MSSLTSQLPNFLQLNRTPKEIEGLRREYKILHGLSHPNIIKMLDSFETDYEVQQCRDYFTLFLFFTVGNTSEFVDHPSVLFTSLTA